jgi:hypothetical protein
VHAALAKLAGYDVAGAALAVIAGLGCMLLAWRTLLADLGSPLPLPAAIRVMFVGQLGKYVPSRRRWRAAHTGSRSCPWRGRSARLRAAPGLPR